MVCLIGDLTFWKDCDNVDVRLIKLLKSIGLACALLISVCRLNRADCQAEEFTACSVCIKAAVEFTTF